MLNITFSPHKYSSRPNLCQIQMLWMCSPRPKLRALLKTQRTARWGQERSFSWQHSLRCSHRKPGRLWLWEGTAVAPPQCVRQLPRSTSYPSSQCRQCHPEDPPTSGLSPFAEAALESHCSSAVRTQQSAVGVKGKTNVKNYEPLNFLDHRLSKIGGYLVLRPYFPAWEK